MSKSVLEWLIDAICIGAMVFTALAVINMVNPYRSSFKGPLKVGDHGTLTEWDKKQLAKYGIHFPKFTKE